MFNFDKSDFQRFAVSSVGALAVSAACLIGAAGQAKAAAPAPSAAEWQKQVESKISGTDDNLSALDGSDKVHKVTLAADFTAEGRFAGVHVAESSGNRGLDYHAREVARRVHYPTLPVAYRGQPETVTMRLYFGNDATEVAKVVRRERPQFAWSTNAGGAGTQMIAR